MFLRGRKYERAHVEATGSQAISEGPALELVGQRLPRRRPDRPKHGDRAWAWERDGLGDGVTTARESCTLSNIRSLFEASIEDVDAPTHLILLSGLEHLPDIKSSRIAPHHLHLFWEMVGD